MQRKKSGRRNRAPVWLDFGTPERQSRGEIIIIGEGRLRQGRVADVVSQFNEREQHAALYLLHLAEQAQYDGFHCGRLSWSASSPRMDGPSAKACHARHELYKIQCRIVPQFWSVIFFVLISCESQALYSVRARIRRQSVRALLQASLASVADIIRA